MKKIKIYFAFVFLALLTGVFSCSSDDKLVDDVLATTERGLILRTVGTPIGVEFDINDPQSVWGVTVEAQDSENGGLLSEVRVYVTYVDTDFPDEASDVTTDEALAFTVPASSFSAGPFGFPRGDISMTYAEAIAATGIADDDIEGGDVFSIRLEAELTDGRVYTNNAAGTVLNGSFFTSPFAYTSAIVCPPVPPTAGTWTIDMQDTYGDGWQTSDTTAGDPVTVTLNDGTVIEFGMCSPYGPSSYTCTPGTDSASTTIEIPVGTTTADWYFPGDAYGEIELQIYTPNGNLVGSVTAGSNAGPITIDFCKP